MRRLQPPPPPPLQPSAPVVRPPRRLPAAEEEEEEALPGHQKGSGVVQVAEDGSCCYVWAQGTHQGQKLPQLRAREP